MREESLTCLYIDYVKEWITKSNLKKGQRKNKCLNRLGGTKWQMGWLPIHWDFSERKIIFQI